MIHHTNTFLYHGKTFAFPHLTVQETLDIKEEFAKGEVITVTNMIEYYNTSIPQLNARQWARFIDIILHKDRVEKSKKGKASSLPMVATITKIAMRLEQGIDTILAMRYSDFLDIIDNLDAIFKDED